MVNLLIRRLLQSIFVILIVSIVLFVGMRTIPGDPILMYLSQGQLGGFSPEKVDVLRHEYGLDKPMIQQYFDWIAGIFHGDLGKSIYFHTSVTSELATSLPITLHISGLALIIGYPIGILAGIICAVRRNTWIDTVVTVLANVGITIPVFWLGMMLMYFISLQLKLLPIYGYVSLTTNFWDSTKHIIIPVFCETIFSLAATARQTRSSMLEVMRQDYIRTAWSKGLKERIVIMKHGLKNALIPVATLVGLGIAQVIGGAVLVETVFNISGMGRLTVTSILNHDYPLTQGVTLVFASVVVFVNFAVDIFVGWLDPRVRLQ